MSYLVLARKYRPRNFAEMVGQTHVVQALGNALRTRRLHHAYLFTGTRGVGKTTVARILAKSLNCLGVDGQGGITDQPCGVCEACRDIDAGRFVDYTELDAASNRGIDEITLLLEQAVYKPVVGRFKVFMIDEVHMLTNPAFNAMLKTLEEPPDYLKFVLATTDPQKVPATVLSRCLQFNLRPMAPETVREHLTMVLDTENVVADAQALHLLSRAARGSMRDALSLTDQAIAFGAGQLDEASVRTMLGSVDRSYVIRLVDALARNDGKTVVETSEALRLNGLSAATTLEDMTTLLQQMAVLQSVPDLTGDDQTDPDSAETARLARVLPPDETQLLYSLCLHGRGELGLAPDEYAALTMVLLRLLAFKPRADTHGADTPTARGNAAKEQGAQRSEPHQPAPQQRTRPLLNAAAVSVASTRAIPPADTLTAAPVVSAGARKVVSEETHSAATGAPASLEEIAKAQAAAERVEPATGSESTSVLPEPAPRADAGVPVSAPSDEDAHPTLAARWNELVAQLISSEAVAALTRELALQSQLMGQNSDVWSLQVEKESLSQSSAREKLQIALRSATGVAGLTLAVTIGPVTDTPAQRNTAAHIERQRAAEAAIHSDPFVQDMIRDWGAKIVPGSIKPLPNRSV